MTLQEIQYKAQGIIHKWRDDDSAPYIEFVEELAHMTVPEPSEDLEEAARKYQESVPVDTRIHYCGADEDVYFANRIVDAVIVGAKWQAERLLSGRPLPEDTVLFNKGVAEGKRLEREDMTKDCVIVECYVRVYPTLDDKPRPWVALYKNGIGCNSLRDIPELENIGFKDNDTAIVIIKRKGDGQ